MPDRFLKMFVFVLFAAMPGLLTAGDELAGPRIVFDAETVQAGQVVRGQVVEAEFVYRNEGDAPLRILRAKPG